MDEILKGYSINPGIGNVQDTTRMDRSLPAPEETIKMMSDLMIQKEYVNKMTEMSHWFNKKFPKDK